MAVIGNDAEGLAKAAERLGQFFAAKPAVPQPPQPAAAQLAVGEEEEKEPEDNMVLDEARLRTLAVLSFTGGIAGLSEVEMYSRKGLK